MPSFYAGSRVASADSDTWDPCREHCATVYSAPACSVSDDPLQPVDGGPAFALYSEPHWKRVKSR